MNRLQKALIKAYQDGYRVIDGIAYKPNGDPLEGTPDRYGYISIKPNKDTPVYVHRLLAYQKYGDRIFNSDVECRHKDNNKLNNLDENIVLGDHSRNMMDIPKEQRMEKSIKAATKKRRFTDEEMNQIRKDYILFQSYDKVMEKWNISSKGTLHYMLNKTYVTKI
jgi:hypothetical protein